MVDYAKKCAIGAIAGAPWGPAGIGTGCIAGALYELDTQYNSERDSKIMLRDLKTDLTASIGTKLTTDLTASIGFKLEDVKSIIRGTEKKIGTIETKVGGIQTRVDGIQIGVRGIQIGVGEIKTRLDEVKTESVDTKYDIHKYLINNRIKPSDIKTAMESTSVLQSLRSHLQTLEKHNARLSEIKTKEEHLRTISTIQTSFTTLGNLGQRINSPALVTISQTGSLVTQISTINQTFSSIMTQPFSLMSLCEPISLIANLAIGFIGLFGKSKSSSNNGILKMVRALATHIDRHMENMHEHLDIIQGQINQVAGLVNYSIQNQEKIYKLQFETYKLVKKTFNIIYNKLDTLTTQTRDELKNIHDDIKYIILTDELGDIKNFKTNVKVNVNIIKEMASINQTLCIEKLIQLKTMMVTLGSKDWNGYNIYDGIKNNSRQCSEFILRNTKMGDYCLTIVAEKYENFSETSLVEHGIDKDILFSNVLWNELVLGIFDAISSSNVGSIGSSFDVENPQIVYPGYSEMLEILENQINNTTGFINHVKENHTTLFEKIINKHRKLVDGLVFIMFYMFSVFKNKTDSETDEVDIKNRKSESDGKINGEINGKQLYGNTLDKYLWELDENYLIGKLFENLIGAHGLRLPKSSDIMDIKYDINVLKSECAYISYSQIPSHGERIGRNHELDLCVDPIGAMNFGNTICYAMVSDNGTDLKINNFNVEDNKFETAFEYKDIKLWQNSKSYTFGGGWDTGVRCMHVNKQSATNTLPQAWMHIFKYNLHGINYIIVYSTNGQIAQMNISTMDWTTIYDPNLILQIPCTSGRKVIRPNVPIYSTPMNTCLTTIVGGDMIFHIFDWHIEDGIHVRYEIYEIYYKRIMDKKTNSWLIPKNIVFDNNVVTSPNQCFAQLIKEFTTTPYFWGDYVVGVLRQFTTNDETLEEKTEREFTEHLGWTFNNDHKNEMVVELHYRKNSLNEWKKTIIRTGIKIRYVNQTKTLKLGEQLIIVTSITLNDKDKTNELVCIVLEQYQWNNFFVIRQKLTNAQDTVIDHQALRVNVISIGTKKYILAIVLDKDNVAQIYCFDVETKTSTRLMDGPKIELSPTGNNMRRSFYNITNVSGFYPVRGYEINIREVDDMIVLYFAFTRIKGNNGGNRELEVIPVKLGPKFVNVIENKMIVPREINNNLMLSLVNAQLLITRMRGHLLPIRGESEIKNEIGTLERKIEIPEHKIEIPERKIEIKDIVYKPMDIQRLKICIKAMNKWYSDSKSEIKLKDDVGDLWDQYDEIMNRINNSMNIRDYGEVHKDLNLLNMILKVSLSITEYPVGNNVDGILTG